MSKHIINSNTNVINNITTILNNNTKKRESILVFIHGGPGMGNESGPIRVMKAIQALNGIEDPEFLVVYRQDDSAGPERIDGPRREVRDKRLDLDDIEKLFGLPKDSLLPDSPPYIVDKNIKLVSLTYYLSHLNEFSESTIGIYSRGDKTAFEKLKVKQLIRTSVNCFDTDKNSNLVISGAPGGKITFSEIFKQVSSPVANLIRYIKTKNPFYSLTYGLHHKFIEYGECSPSILVHNLASALMQLDNLPYFIQKDGAKIIILTNDIAPDILETIQDKIELLQNSQKKIVFYNFITPDFDDEHSLRVLDSLTKQDILIAYIGPQSFDVFNSLVALSDLTIGEGAGIQCARYFDIKVEDGPLLKTKGFLNRGILSDHAAAYKENAPERKAKKTNPNLFEEMRNASMSLANHWELPSDAEPLIRYLKDLFSSSPTELQTFYQGIAEEADNSNIFWSNFLNEISTPIPSVPSNILLPLLENANPERLIPATTLEELSMGLKSTITQTIKFGKGAALLPVKTAGLLGSVGTFSSFSQEYRSDEVETFDNTLKADNYLLLGALLILSGIAILSLYYLLFCCCKNKTEEILPFTPKKSQ